MAKMTLFTIFIGLLAVHAIMGRRIGRLADAVAAGEANALKAFGCDKPKIRYYLENNRNFVGQHGIFNYSESDHNGLTKEAFQMVVVKNGDWALAD